MRRLGPHRVRGNGCAELGVNKSTVGEAALQRSPTPATNALPCPHPFPGGDARSNAASPSAALRAGDNPRLGGSVTSAPDPHPAKSQEKGRKEGHGGFGSPVRGRWPRSSVLEPTRRAVISRTNTPFSLPPSDGAHTRVHTRDMHAGPEKRAKRKRRPRRVAHLPPAGCRSACSRSQGGASRVMAAALWGRAQRQRARCRGPERLLPPEGRPTAVPRQTPATSGAAGRRALRWGPETLPGRPAVRARPAQPLCGQAAPIRGSP